MTIGAAELASGKGHKDENFPVASVFIKPRHRSAIMAFYRFARKADDVADHPTQTAAVKHAVLRTMGDTLSGVIDDDPEALVLRRAQAERGLSPAHGLDLLKAFQQDVDTARYDDWAALMEYCRYSAMPVGRFVLDVHGEARSLWPASDALCAALQIVNHLQDCAKDHRDLDRCYLPQSLLAAHGARVEDLARPVASPGLKATIRQMAEKTGLLLETSRPFAKGVKDARLAFEIAAIQRLAEDLTGLLLRRDPLSERVHHRPLEAFALVALAAKDQIFGRNGARALSVTAPH
jgi:squalene synthase HpnC